MQIKLSLQKFRLLIFKICTVYFDLHENYVLLCLLIKFGEIQKYHYYLHLRQAKKQIMSQN